VAWFLTSVALTALELSALSGHSQPSPYRHACPSCVCERHRALLRVRRRECPPAEAEAGDTAADWNGDPRLAHVGATGVRTAHRVCFPNGTCVCDDGWMGVTCSQGMHLTSACLLIRFFNRRAEGIFTRRW
jgi:hypothetical protein